MPSHTRRHPSSTKDTAQGDGSNSTCIFAASTVANTHHALAAPFVLEDVDTELESRWADLLGVYDLSLVSTLEDLRAG